MCGCMRVRCTLVWVYVPACTCMFVCTSICVGVALGVTVLSVPFPGAGLIPLQPVAGCTPLTRGVGIVSKEILGAQTWDQSQIFHLLSS